MFKRIKLSWGTTDFKRLSFFFIIVGVVVIFVSEIFSQHIYHLNELWLEGDDIKHIILFLQCIESTWYLVYLKRPWIFFISTLAYRMNTVECFNPLPFLPSRYLSSLVMPQRENNIGTIHRAIKHVLSLRSQAKERRCIRHRVCQQVHAVARQFVPAIARTTTIKCILLGLFWCCMNHLFLYALTMDIIRMILNDCT